jgi:protein SCO1
MPKAAFFDRRRWLIASALGMSLAGCKPAQLGKQSFHSIDLTGATYANEFSLTDHNGQPRTLKDYQGKAVVLFFGFLNCPDVCPSAMAHWASVTEKLSAAEKDRVQVLFVTVDPARDKAGSLKSYVTHFNPNFVGLYGDEDRVQAVSRVFRVFVSKQAPDAKGNYGVDHTAASFVFDAAGKIRLYVRPEITAEQAKSDLLQILKTAV